MAEINDTAFFDYLIAEYQRPFSGWDLAYLDGRRTESHGDLPWDYTDTVIVAMKQAHALLDMRTGGGEQLARFLAHQPVPEVYATEGYKPNVTIARQRLEALGVTVYEVRDEHLPFADDSLDLITNRHGSYDPREVLRVLKTGHLFITQQVGDQTNLRLHELLGRTQKGAYFYPGTEQKPTWNVDYALHELVGAGWQIVEQKEAFISTRFHDVGAIVYYLKAIPWEVPDFSVEKYFDRLVEIHHLIQRDGYVDVPFHMFFIVARKG